MFAIWVYSHTSILATETTWKQFHELHNQVVRYHIGLKATHPFSSHPLSWPVMQKPVWIYMGHDEFGNELNIWSTGNKWTWYGGLVAVAYFVAVLVARLVNVVRQSGEAPLTKGDSIIRNRSKKSKQPAFGGFLTRTLVNFLSPHNLKILFLLTAYLGMFVPWALSPRIMFIYHYLPALPFLFLILAEFVYEGVDTTKQSVIATLNTRLKKFP